MTESPSPPPADPEIIAEMMRAIDDTGLDLDQMNPAYEQNLEEIAIACYYVLTRRDDAWRRGFCEGRDAAAKAVCPYCAKIEEFPLTAGAALHAGKNEAGDGFVVSCRSYFIRALEPSDADTQGERT